MLLRGAAVLALGAFTFPGLDLQTSGRDGDFAVELAGAPPALADVHEGVVRMVTYNVAGLPWLVAGSRRGRNMPHIGRLLNAFDLALVQEDFGWHDELSRAARHPFRSREGSAAGARQGGDGSHAGW